MYRERKRNSETKLDWNSHTAKYYQKIYSKEIELAKFEKRIPVIPGEYQHTLLARTIWKKMISGVPIFPVKKEKEHREEKKYDLAYVRDLRERSKLTIREIAELTGMASPTLYNITTGTGAYKSRQLNTQPQRLIAFLEDFTSGASDKSKVIHNPSNIPAPAPDPDPDPTPAPEGASKNIDILIETTMLLGKISIMLQEELCPKLK